MPVHVGEGGVDQVHPVEHLAELKERLALPKLTLVIGVEEKLGRGILLDQDEIAAERGEKLERLGQVLPDLAPPAESEPLQKKRRCVFFG
jgi:hypothetical protein